ncbi:glycoside hydrolase family 30 protein [Cloacibacterium sp.]|uniref:glycoside hydrolase family 30 protein n=1 Tax=Cloacibacterium sp. TaxID=1913682 RepID=UPI0039E4CAE7
MITKKIVSIIYSVALISCVSCNSLAQEETSKKNIDAWLTKADETIKLQKQSSILSFTTASNSYQNIEVNPSKTYQTIDGFGYTLTGGSVEVINQLSSAKKEALLQELFGNGESSIGVSYLRLSIGVSDLNSSVFSYNDLPAGQTDVTLSQFSLSKDQALVDMLKKILTINPNIKIIATPWSPPVWMKDNGSSIGGSLKTEYYGVYAQYFVKYIQEMKKNGITIDAVTPQNEPLHPGNNPSMYMTAEQQRDFIKNNLGPAFQTANLSTKIIVYDHNCDKPEYPLTILADTEASKFVDGSAFHLYAGNILILNNVHNAYPDKNVYFTEQWTGSTGTFSGDLMWHTKNVVIGSMRNWSKIALEWNIANDAAFNPHTPGGCTECKGAITINNSETFTRNVGYYIIAQASKFIPQNSVRISSTESENLSTVAFKTPAGKIALIVLNDGANNETFNIKYNDKVATTSLSANSVATYIF